MKKEKAIDALNSLVTINNDRIEGYETASKETEEPDLKTLFAQFISTSQKCRQELVREVTALGGEVAEGTKTSGKFFRAWMDFKVALSGKDRKAILNSCEFGEEKAKDTYDDALENDSEHLTGDHRNMIINQKAMLKGDRDHIKSLLDALGDH
ncbi:MAG: PA2169 family four-helix-bundle protein [Bacteroidales bacterium]|nr:PA2169 family four-helix-bundle protein [Bacteroidales bacterium]